MSHRSYNNIKKYAAFIFMIFTVISGSSERFDTDSFVKVGRKTFIDILAVNRQLIQDTRTLISESRTRSSIKQNEGFKNFLDINVDDSVLKYIDVYIVGLLIPIYFLNNFILRNNIWRNAVF